MDSSNWSAWANGSGAVKVKSSTTILNLEDPFGFDKWAVGKLSAISE